MTMRGLRGMGYCPWEDLRRREDLTFAVARLPVADAMYFPDIPGIVLDDRLTRIERRCVLAHELAHLDLGHHHQVAGNGSGTGRLARRREREADELAARRLVELPALAGALSWAQRSCEVADELEVTEHLLRVRIDTLLGGEQLYLRAHRARTEEVA